MLWKCGEQEFRGVVEVTMHSRGVVDSSRWHGPRMVKSRYPRIAVRCLEKAQPHKEHRGMCIRQGDSSDGVDSGFG